MKGQGFNWDIFCSVCRENYMSYSSSNINDIFLMEPGYQITLTHAARKTVNTLKY